jgi:hypothetical protein
VLFSVTMGTKEGYGPHVRNISRWQITDQLERQNQLILDGWTVIRFSYDEVIDLPRRCKRIHAYRLQDGVKSPFLIY